MLKKTTLFILSKLSKLIITKHKPFVIGITWTVGKTTASNFTYEFLSNLYSKDVYISPYDYNWEFWLPLTILQSKSPNKNVFLWILVFIKSIYLYFNKNYPKYLILEYWIDHIGEMEFLTDIVKPDIAILLNISPNHVMQFPDYSDYIKEKILLWKVSKKVIYNSDDENLSKYLKKLPNSYSFSAKNESSNLFAKNIESSISWLNFSICDSSNCTEVNYSILGDHQVYNILPVFLLWELLNINLEKVKDILKEVHPQKWRWTILKGVRDSIIIDWSYNWWFASISSWVKYIQNLEWDFNKILFLWEMRELWNESKKIHTELVDILLNSWYNYLVLVWEEMKKYVYESIKEKLWEGNVFYYNSSKDAWNKVREIIKSTETKSIIYVKWSQNTIFLEEWIKNFLFDMQDSKKLCRQSDNWLKIKEDFFSHIL